MSLKSIGTLSTLLKEFGTGNAALRQIGQSLQLFSTESIIAAASAKKLTKAQLEQILTGKGLTAEEIKAALATTSFATAEGAATVATGGFTAALKGLGAVMLANPILLAATAITIAVVGITQAVKKHNEAIAEAQQATEEAASTYNDTVTSIDEYKSKIAELKTELDSGNLSEQETYEKRQQLLSIQDEVVDKLGNEAKAFNILKGSIDDVNSSFDNYTASQAKSFLTEHKDELERATREMEKIRNLGNGIDNTIFSSYYAEIPENAKVYNQVKKIFTDVFGNNIEFQELGDGRISYKLNVDARSAVEGLEQVNSALYDLDKELSRDHTSLDEMLGLNAYNQTWKNAISVSKKQAQEILDEFANNYDTSIQLRIQADFDPNRDDDYTDLLDQVAQFKKDYEQAITDGNETAAKSAYENMQTLVPKFEEIDDEGVKNYFSDLVKAFNDANEDYQLEIELKARLSDDEDSLNKMVKDAVKQFEKENGKVDVYTVLNTGIEYDNNPKKNSRRGTLPEEQQAYVKLKVAADSYGMSVEELLNLLDELGMVQLEVADDAKEVEKSVATLSETIDHFATAEKSIGTISDALGDFKENGFVAAQSLKELTETFGSLDSFDNFVKVMGDSSSSMVEAQQACNQLAEEYINSIGILDDLNESNAGVIETMLTEMGVTNAHELVRARLNAIELEGKLAAEGLADAEWETAEKTLLASGASESAVASFKKLRQEQYNAALTATDFKNASADTIGTLLTQAKAAGIAAQSISALAKAQSLKERYESGELKNSRYWMNSNSGSSKSRYEEALERYAQEAVADISDVSIAVPTVNVKIPKSSKSSSKKKTAEELFDEQMKELEDAFDKSLSGMEHKIFLLEKNGVSGISEAALAGLRDALSDYQAELQEATEKGFDISKTVYGNIDTNNRQILEWTDANLAKFKDALESWGETVDEMRGSISTVFGSSEEFDGIEIAFSPILQTENGPVLLDSDTVHEYIWGLIDNAGENWTNEQLLRLDTEGLEFDGRIIKNLLADIGETAIQTGEAMHYVGSLGSIQQAYAELEKLSKAQGLSAKELSKAIADNDFSHSLTHSAYRTANQIVTIYEQMQEAVHKQAELYRSMGLNDDSEYIQSLQKQWWEYSDSIKDVIVESYDTIVKEHENAITLNENLLEQAIKKNDRGAITKNTGEIVDHYKTMQEEIHQQAEFYRSLGYSETSDEVSSLSDLWWDYYDKIKTVSAEAWQQVVDNAHDALDEITGLYDTLKNAAQEFSESGFITVSTFQEIAKLGVENLAYLQDENGMLVINEENIQKVIAARTQQMAIETALNYVQQLRQALADNDVVALMNLTTATDAASNSTWDLVYAQLQLLGLDQQQYNNALNRINALRSLSDVAITSIGKVDGAAKKAIEDQASALDDLLKYVEEMIKQEVKNQVEALEDQVDSMKEIVDLQKKSLDLEREKDNYTKNVAEKTKELAKLQQQLALQELDDSRESAAKQAKLREQIADLTNDLADDQADHAYDVTSDMLDDMADSYEKEKQKEIDILENTISSEEKLYQLAIDRINNHWDTLYQDLINWNYEYGSVTNDEITKAWDAASAAVQQYGSYLNAILETQRQIASYEANSGSGSYTIDTGSGSNKNSAIGKTGNYDTSGGAVMTQIKTIVHQMKENSAAHHSADKAGKARLNKANLDLGKQLTSLTGRTAVRGDDGVWYLDRVGGPKLYETYPYSTYHTGGIVGDDPTLKQDEVFAKLKKGEAVLTEEQQKPIYQVLDFADTMLGKYGKLFSSFSGSDLMGIKMQEQMKQDAQQAQAVVQHSDMSNEFNLTFPMQVLQKLDDAEIKTLTKKISDYTIKELDSVFTMRGKRSLRY